MTSNADLEEVNVLRMRLERYVADSEDDKILRILHKLAGRRISMDCLRETGIGRIVSKLKKYDGQIGSQSRALVNDWKLVAADPSTAAPAVTSGSSHGKSEAAVRGSATSFLPTPSPSSSSGSRNKRRSPSPGPSQSSSSKRSQHTPASSYTVLAELPDLLEDEELKGYLSQSSLNASFSGSSTFSQSQQSASGTNVRRAGARSKMYAGRSKVGRTATHVPKLMELCIKVLMENINLIEEMGPVPYHVIKPVLEQCTADQLKRLETFNQHLIEDSDELWQIHCEKNFKVTELEEDDDYTFRDMYERKVVEREQKLINLTQHINRNTKARAAPVRQTKMAFVDAKTMTKGPRMPRSAGEPLGIKAKLKQMNVPPPPRARGGWGSSSSSAAAISRPAAKKAPLMQKCRKTFMNQSKR